MNNNQVVTFLKIKFLKSNNPFVLNVVKMVQVITQVNKSG